MGLGLGLVGTGRSAGKLRGWVFRHRLVSDSDSEQDLSSSGLQNSSADLPILHRQWHLCSHLEKAAQSRSIYPPPSLTVALWLAWDSPLGWQNAWPLCHAQPFPAQALGGKSRLAWPLTAMGPGFQPGIF